MKALSDHLEGLSCQNQDYWDFRINGILGMRQLFLQKLGGIAGQDLGGWCLFLHLD
jgi:hypothetical protein